MILIYMCLTLDYYFFFVYLIKIRLLFAFFILELCEAKPINKLECLQCKLVRIKAVKCEFGIDSEY